MKDFIKKGAKGVADIGSSAVKSAVTAVIGDLVKEILEETGVTNIAKEKMMDAGLKVFKDMNMDPQKIQREIIKSAIMKEFNL